MPLSWYSIYGRTSDLHGVALCCAVLCCVVLCCVVFQCRLQNAVTQPTHVYTHWIAHRRTHTHTWNHTIPSLHLQVEGSPNRSRFPTRHVLVRRWLTCDDLTCALFWLFPNHITPTLSHTITHYHSIQTGNRVQNPYDCRLSPWCWETVWWTLVGISHTLLLCFVSKQGTVFNTFWSSLIE